MATSATKDCLNGSILPNREGASGGKGLPPRTHAIHTILFHAKGPISQSEIESSFRRWGTTGRRFA
jgi:hypothetical protein